MTDQGFWAKSQKLALRFEFLDQVDSTNEWLRSVSAEVADWPHGSVVVTDDQTSGRGRQGRKWVTKPGKSLAVSVLLRPTRLSSTGLGWIPLIAGTAMVKAIAMFVGGKNVGEKNTVGFKWPNDVLIANHKVCGILCERIPPSNGSAELNAPWARSPAGGGVIVGAGLNLTLEEHELPVETATSLKLATGMHPEADQILADYLAQLLSLFDSFDAKAGDPVASGIADLVAEHCKTLGNEVRVELPGGAEIYGKALFIDSNARLVLQDHQTKQPISLVAGEVIHLRSTAGSTTST